MPRKSNLPTLRRARRMAEARPQIPCARFPSAPGNLPNLRLRLARSPLRVKDFGPGCRCGSGFCSPSCWCWSPGPGVGLALAGLEARQWLRDELWTAQLSAHLQVARRFLRAAARRDRGRRARWPAWSATFSGNRHLQAVVVDPGGRVIAASEPAPAGPAAPALVRRPDAPRHPADAARHPRRGRRGRGAAAALRRRHRRDLGGAARHRAGAGARHGRRRRRGVRPGDLGDAAGDGRRPGAAAGSGPATTPPARPSRGRRRSSRWGAGSTRWPRGLPPCASATARLEEQILTLQDEERADIARDLHDEIGPHLFAANVDAAMAATLIGAGQGRKRRWTRCAASAPPSATSSGWCATSWGASGPRIWPSSGSPALSSTWSRSGAARRPDIGFETELPGEEDEPAGAGAGDPLPPGAGEPQQRRPPRRADVACGSRSGAPGMRPRSR